VAGGPGGPAGPPGSRRHPVAGPGDAAPSVVLPAPAWRPPAGHDAPRLSAGLDLHADEFLQHLDALLGARGFGGLRRELDHLLPHLDRLAIDAGIGERHAHREVRAVRARLLLDDLAQEIDRLGLAAL